jgi:hypothetical protein
LSKISELKDQVLKLRFKIVAKAFVVFLRYTKKMEKKRLLELSET